VHVKDCLLFFKDVEVGILNCNVKWKISEKVKLFDVKHITCMSRNLIMGEGI
jgi:hypothetical protein